MLIDGSEIGLIDVDTHVVEPPDLWTARLPASLRDQAPQVKTIGDEDWWCMNDEPVFPALIAAHAGWREYAPSYPPSWESAQPYTYDAKARLGLMDNYGIKAQILYPNLAMFSSGRLQKSGDRSFQTLILQTFNDWQFDWSSEDPTRLLPMASLPFWSIEDSIAEIERLMPRGLKGVVFSQNPAAFGLPSIVDRHWDQLWGFLQESGLPVNFHIGSGEWSTNLVNETLGIGVHALYASKSVGLFLANAQTMSNLIFGGVCARFPDLKFVSVESGVGYIPFLLEAMDWQFLGCGVRQEHPELDLLPSEYWRRQFYACFWFERGGVVDTINRIGSDNILFETDFPHPTSQSPGPASPAVEPEEYVRLALGSLSMVDQRKILHDNASKLYKLQ